MPRETFTEFIRNHRAELQKSYSNSPPYDVIMSCLMLARGTLLTEGRTDDDDDIVQQLTAALSAPYMIPQEILEAAKSLLINLESSVAACHDPHHPLHHEVVLFGRVVANLTQEHEQIEL